MMIHHLFAPQLRRGLVAVEVGNEGFAPFCRFYPYFSGVGVCSGIDRAGDRFDFFRSLVLAFIKVL